MLLAMAVSGACLRERRDEWQRSYSLRIHRIDPHRPRDVLDALLPQVLEIVGELVANVIPHRAGNADPAGLGQGFQPCGDVDAVAVDVTALGDYIAEIDPDAEGDPLILGDVGIAVDHRPLQLDGAADRIDDAGKFDQHPVAGSLYYPAVVLLDLRIDKL